ncbi:MAG: NAD(+)/NADH kinase [archaeon]
MFNKILVTYNEKLSDKHLRTLENVKGILKGTNFSLAKSHHLNAELFNGVDLVITIGGDGTFIRSASFIEDALILGINSEPELSEGALTTIMENEVDFLKGVLEGRFNIEERERICVKLNGKILDKPALNEVYVGTESQFHTSRYVIEYRSVKEEQRSSGVLICTGIGSGAWYKSAGGIPFSKNEKKLKFIVREPYFGRVYKPKILHGEIPKNEKILFECKRDYGGALSIDSNYSFPLKKGDIAEVSILNKPLRVVKK